MNYDCDFYIRPYLGERRSGDLIVIKTYREEDSDQVEDLVLIVVDMMGHGPDAAKGGDVARAFLSRTELRTPEKLFEGLNRSLKGVLGAAGGICRFNLKTNEMTWIGVGNVHMKTFSNDKNFICQDGIIGEFKRELRIQKNSFSPGDVFLFASDGVTTNFQLKDFPQWKTMSPKALATTVVKKFGSDKDDSSCAIIKFYD